jgi:ADP-ribose pyrophosphatase
VNSQNRKKKEQKALIETILRHKGNRISLVSMVFKDNEGISFTSDVIKHPGAVALLPITEKGEVMLIRQWRRAIENILIEIPAGTIEPSEPPKECAIRELQEEVGYKPLNLTSLGGFYASPGFCNEYIHLFLARDLVISQLKAEDSEGIDVFTLPLEEALSWVQQGKICDSKTISALCLYQLWLSSHKR